MIKDSEYTKQAFAWRQKSANYKCIADRALVHTYAWSCFEI